MARECFGGMVTTAVQFAVGLPISLIQVMAFPKPSDLVSMVIGAVLAGNILIAFSALATYRIRSGQGWLSGAVLAVLSLNNIPSFLLLFQLIFPGTIGIGLAVVVQAAIVVSLAFGSYACWQIRLRERRGETRSPNDLQTLTI